MSNLLWYKQNDQWINPIVLSKKNDNFVESPLYYKAKNRWVLLDREKYQLDTKHISKCADKESFISLLEKSFPKNRVETNINNYILTDNGVDFLSPYNSNIGNPGNTAKLHIQLILQANLDNTSITIHDVLKPKYIDLGCTLYFTQNNGYFLSIVFVGNISKIRYNICTFYVGTNYPYNYPDWCGLYTDNLESYEFHPTSYVYDNKIDVSSLTHCFTDERDTSYDIEIYKLFGHNSCLLNKFILEY